MTTATAPAPAPDGETGTCRETMETAASTRTGSDCAVIKPEGSTASSSSSTASSTMAAARILVPADQITQSDILLWFHHHEGEDPTHQDLDAAGIEVDEDEGKDDNSRKRDRQEAEAEAPAVTATTKIGSDTAGTAITSSSIIDDLLSLRRFGNLKYIDMLKQKVSTAIAGRIETAARDVVHEVRKNGGCAVGTEDDDGDKEAYGTNGTTTTTSSLKVSTSKTKTMKGRFLAPCSSARTGTIPEISTQTVATEDAATATLDANIEKQIQEVWKGQGPASIASIWYEVSDDVAVDKVMADFNKLLQQIKQRTQQRDQHQELRPFVEPDDDNDVDENYDDDAVFDSDFTATLPLQAIKRQRTSAAEISSAGKTYRNGSGDVVVVVGGVGIGDSCGSTATTGASTEKDTTLLLPPLPTSSYEMYKWIETTFNDTTANAINGDMTRFALFSRRIQVLVGWAKMEDPTTFHYFLLGGLVEKILGFVHANEHNPSVLKDPLELLVICTHHFDRKNEKSIKTTTTTTTTEAKESASAAATNVDANSLPSTVSSMQATVITYNGISILLSAVRYLLDDNRNDGNTTTNMLPPPPVADDEQIEQFWRVFWNIVGNRSAVKTHLDVAGQVSLVQFAFLWIEKLPEHCVKTARQIPYVLSNLLITAVAMTDPKDATSSSLSIFSVRNIAHCITIINGRKPTWLDDPNIMFGFLKFLRLCLRYHDKIKSHYAVVGKGTTHTDEFYGKLIVKLCLRVLEKHRATCPTVVTCSMSIITQTHENLYQITRSDFPPTPTPPLPSPPPPSTAETGVGGAGPGPGPTTTGLSSGGVLSILASIAESTILSDKVKESSFQILKTIR
eukprot:CAMPEP_0113502960 /NCGR_PEP_ID=MMETSP0014_2-20120614/33869_1 /TAXON_ID=2857 /ORGANISM="Nitzschia sp." /LENGTH=846 /DNA_ID=CAMNT_0000397855 /DNA_START=229 /DNA_END=2769 /DNA_ORIENTATION=+ /assembly_acc=CAM_ASM_000159